MELFFRKNSFRFKLTAVFVLLASVPIFFAMGFAVFKMRNTQIENAVLSQQRIADSAVSEFSDFISHQFVFLDEAARVYSSSEVSAGTAERLLDRILFSNKNLIDISVAGRNGDEIVHKHRFRLIQPSEFRNIAGEEPFLIAEARTNYIGPIVFENGKPQFAIARAMFDSLKRFNGVVTATVDARAMQDVVDSISAVQDGGRAYVVNRNGVVVAHPDISNVLAKRDFSFIPIVSAIKGGTDSFNPKSPYRNETGRKVLGAFSTVAVVLEGAFGEVVETRWFIVAEEPSSVALAAVNNITLVSVLILLAVLAGAFAAALIFARRVVGPVELLHKTMLKFGKGDLKARVKIETGDEIEDLSKGFNKMAGDLSRALGNLERDKKIISADRDKLAEMDKIKKEFVSLAAHQMRTPLSGISWLMNILASEDAGRLNTKQKKLLEQGTKNAALIKKMIDELLDTARMEEGKYLYKTEKVDVLPVLKEVFEFYKNKIEEKKLSFNFSAPKFLPPALIDPHSLRIAFMNIFENAVFYTKPGGKIGVSASEDAGKILISVKDSGIGIPEEEKKNIFEKFFRGKAALHMETEGTGIGLYMSKNVLEPQGAGVRLESKEGEGTEVFITLPIFKEALRASPKRDKIGK